MPAAKPYNVLIYENKSHRTKEELIQRKQAEEELYTGKSLKERPEIKENEVAHKEFSRIKKLMKSIQKDDDIFSGPINRYCMIFAECRDFECKRAEAYQRILELEDRKSDFEEKGELKEYFVLIGALEKHLIDIDKQVQTKRKMLFDIEKENLMTVAAAMRSIPKKPEKKKSKLEEALT